MNPNDTTPPATEPDDGSPEPAVVPNDDWRERYAQSSREGIRLKAENDQLRAAVDLAARQSLPQRSRPEDRLESLGVPTDSIAEMIEARVQAGIRQAFEPVMQMANARNEVVARHPDYVKFEADVIQYMQADPQRAATYDAIYRVAPAAAIEHALLLYGDQQRKSGKRERGDSNRDSVHASIPSQPSGESRRQPDSGLRRIEEARKRFQTEGTSEAAKEYAKARLGMAISDEHLNA